MRVAQDDIDLYGHASNVAVVRWLQEAARAHSESAGLGFAQYRALGGLFVVRRHEIDYLRPAQLGEDLCIETSIESWSAASSLRRTRVMRGGDALVRAATTWAFVALGSGRPCRIPDSVRAAFAGECRHGAMAG